MNHIGEFKIIKCQSLQRANRVEEKSLNSSRLADTRLATFKASIPVLAPPTVLLDCQHRN